MISVRELPKYNNPIRVRSLERISNNTVDAFDAVMKTTMIFVSLCFVFLFVCNVIKKKERKNSKIETPLSLFLSLQIGEELRKFFFLVLF